MKNKIKYTIILITILFLTGCGPTKYIYIQPEYPKLTAPRKVPDIDGAYLRKECLWLGLRNTNLCGDDLKVVLSQIDKLRVNEKTCEAKVASYNEFVRKKSLEDSEAYKSPKK